MQEYTVESSAVFKQGVGNNGPWTIYKIKLVGDPQEPTGFEPVQPGDKVNLETKQTVSNGKTYNNLNYKKISQSAAQPAQTSHTQSARDPRVVKLLVLVAQQVGVDQAQVLDVLEGQA